MNFKYPVINPYGPAIADECAPAINEIITDIEIPENWTPMLEQLFIGKEYGISGFGQEFKMALLLQVANTNRTLEQRAEAAKEGKYRLTVDEINDLIDSYDILNQHCMTRPYVRTMVIATVREDLGRAYLKALQARGQMLGISYDDLGRSLLETEMLPGCEMVEADVAANLAV